MPDTELGERCLVEDGAVLGKRPRLREGSSAAGTHIGPLVLADGVTVCCGAVVYAGAEVGERAIIGDQAQVREGARVGPRSGRRPGVVRRLRGAGRRTRPDPDRGLRHRRVGRRGRRVPWPGRHARPTITPWAATPPASRSRARRSGERAGSVAAPCWCPAIEIGEEAFVAAGALVTKNVAARDVVMGVPARVVRQVPDEDLIERWT